jgi:ATP-dependent DNA ligase
MAADSPPNQNAKNPSNCIKSESEPKLLAEIEYRAKSAEGKVRHPFFKGLREDL